MLLSATVLFTILCSNAVLTAAESGFIFQAPRILVRNTDSTVYLKLFDVHDPGKVTVKLLNEAGGVSYYENTVNISKADAEKEITLDVKVPKFTDDVVRLQISGEFQTQDGYEFSGEDVLRTLPDHSKHILIQTEKQVYKAGDTVKFRVMAVDSKLQPLNNTSATVTITTPYGSVVAKWNDVSLENGLKQFELQLTNSLMIGTWYISASTPDMKKDVQFEVKDYAEKKFEVNINPPSFVLQDTEVIPIEICAENSHGRPVKGELTLEGSVGEKQLEILIDEKKISGCYNYTLNMSSVDNEYQYHSGDLKLTAKVTEHKTGANVQATKVLSRSPSAVRLEFKDHAEYFKPGLPYHGTVKVTYPDHTEAEGQHVTVCIKTYYECPSKPKSKLCRNFTSDLYGIVRFTMPPQDTEAISILIEAMPVHGDVPSTPKDAVRADYIGKRLRPWHSETKSYIQIYSIENNLHCHSKNKFQVLYTGEEKKDFQGYYEVINKGRVVDKGAFNFSYNETGIFRTWMDTILRTEVTDSGLVRNQTFPQNASKLQIASSNIELNLTVVNFPVSHLLVYSFAANREVIADSFKFAVGDCLSKDIKVSIGESASKGAQIFVTAPSHSRCEIQAIYKKSSKLRYKMQFEKVLQKLFNYEFGLFHHENHCNNTLPGFSTDYYGDSFAAFESAGFLVISDYKLITRPCENSSAPLNCTFDDAFDTAGNNVSERYQLTDEFENFDETISSFSKAWLFHISQAGESGLSVTEYSLPDSTTQWTGSVVCINKESGMGFSKIDFMKEQFLHMEITVPSRVVMGKSFPVYITLFTLSKKCIPLIVDLQKSSGFEPLEKRPRRWICLCDDKGEYLNFYAKAKSMGTWSVAVTASAKDTSNICDKKQVITPFDTRTVEKSVEVQAEDFTYQESTSKVVCLEDKDAEHKMDVVKDLAVAYHSVSSNIMPKMRARYMGDDFQMKRFEHEIHVAMTMSYVVFTMDYRIATGALTDNVLKDRAVKKLQEGYQRVLSFRQRKGDYYSYTSLDERTTAIYVTSYIVYTFVQASRYIHIDSDDISKACDWLLSVQKEDGTIGTDAETAHVIISLLTFGMSPSQPGIKRAMEYLEKYAARSIELSVSAYAFAMADEQVKAEYFLNKLTLTGALVDGVLYWSGGESLSSYYGNFGITGMTAVRILTMLKLGKPPNDCAPSIRWLISKEDLIDALSRKWWTTWDAIAAMEALSRYAQYTSYGDLNVQINVSSALNKDFHLKKEDEELVKKEKLPATTNSSSNTDSDYGCFEIKTMIQYNKKTPVKFFDLMASTSHSSDCKTASIRIRARYTDERPIISQRRGTTTALDVYMISGYDPDEESFKKLRGDKQLGDWRYKIEKGYFYFFLYDFGTKWKEFDIQFKRSAVVKDAKPEKIIIQDLDYPEVQRISYSIDGCM